MTLEDQISSYRRQIATDSYPMSIGEISNLYRDGEIDIHPEFQRIFRWRESQKSRLIESILLGIPLPSVFVAQNENGVWDVVDGVQRLSTIFQFMGILKNEDGGLHEPLVCSEAPFLTQLEGCSYSPTQGAPSSLSPTQRLDFKRARVDMKIIKRESDNRAKYDLFQRLNSFGTVATEQELRNCLIVSMSKKHFEWLLGISADENFKSSIDLASRLIEERYHMELALRFVFLRTIEPEDLASIRNIGDFLTSRLVAFADFSDQRLEEEKEAFTRTFQAIASAGGPDILRRWNHTKAKPEGSFSLTAFEAIALGIGHHFPDQFPSPSEITTRQSELWSNPQFSAGHATGLRGDQRMKKAIPFGRMLFSK
ncbi:DUF262 domain-containing protein [Kitasatospora fiedleri]|uniref:DUF262 domain-containing protein n=1 Tax=Kitasatospora fiedleri TaxID=2991545 RepID=UPI00249C1F38|nr:DUF262 domain-containing protein [Kitasatospora fiedleri]